MESDTKYNGWTNHETWCVNLWLTNDQGLYNTAREIVTDVDETEATLRLKTWVEEMNPLADDPTFWADLINGALSEVNWSEITRSFREE